MHQGLPLCGQLTPSAAPRCSAGCNRQLSCLAADTWSQHMQSWTQHQGARHGLRTICSSQWQDQQRRSWREGRHKQHGFNVLQNRLIFGNTSNDEQDR